MHNLIKRSDKIIESIQLTSTEIEVLLSILKESTFKIRDIEPLYRILIKLQEQHQSLNK